MIARLQRFWRFMFRDTAAAQPPEVASLLRLAAGLPDDTRRVVTLHKVYDLAAPDIAARLHLSRAAVDQHLVTAALAYAGCLPITAAPGPADGSSLDVRASRVAVDPSESE